MNTSSERLRRPPSPQRGRQYLIRPASPSTFPSEGKAVPHPSGFAVHTSLLPEEKVLDRSEADEVVLRD